MEATSTATAAADDAPLQGVLTGRPTVYVVVEMFQGCVDDVKLFGTEEEQLAAYEKYTGHAYKEVTDADSWGTFDDEKWAGTVLYDIPISVRECETPGCLGFSINERNVAENHCTLHRAEEQIKELGHQLLAQEHGTTGPQIDARLAALKADVPAMKAEEDRQDLAAGSYDPQGPEEAA